MKRASKLNFGLSSKRRALLDRFLQQSDVETPSAGTIARRPRTSALPLSFAQQRLWFLDQLEPGAPLYNMHSAVRLSGPLQVAALAHSLGQIVQRHESLRTTFTTVMGQPQQRIASELSLPLLIVDLQDLPEPAREAQVQQLALDVALQPFDLARGPLLRVRLLRLGVDAHVLLLCMHHIVSDGWSQGVFVRDLATLYQASTSGQPAVLPELPVQYADFAIWQRDWLQTDASGEEQLAYWKHQLRGRLPVLALPVDRPRPAIQSYRGSRRPLAFSKALTDSLQALSRQAGVTLFMTLLAAFKVLLHRYTGQTDILVGTPIANRDRVEVADLIGVFVNTLVLRTDLSGNPGFRDLLRRVHDVAVGAYAHADLPFEKLVEALQPERDLSHSPLFQVMFVYQTAPAAYQSGDLTVSRLEVEGEIARFDLTLALRESDDGLWGTLEYSTDLFDAGTMTRLLEHFQSLLEGIAADPDRPLSDLPLLPAHERRALLETWNATAAADAPRRCLPQLFEEQVERTPESVAVAFQPPDGGPPRHLTYRALNRRATQLAHHLRACGVGPEVTVGVCLERSPEMVVGVLGILKAGGAYVPLDPAYPSERLAFMLGDARVGVLLTETNLAPRLPTHPAQTILLDTFDARRAGALPENPDHPARPDSLLYVLYTSGSTGTPKGVQVTHQAVTNLLSFLHQRLGFGGSDRILAITPLTFDIAGVELYGPLLAGACLEIAARETASDGVQLAQRLQTGEVTVMQATPATWRMLLDSGWSGAPRLKMLCGGEALTRDLAGQLLARGASLWNLYGPTETTIYSTHCEVTKDAASAVPIGRPVANTQVYLLDAHGQPVPIGVAGELYIGGAGLARGYVNRPDLTAERFIPDAFSGRAGDRLYTTGDLARYRASGEIDYLGRVDHQVKLRGFRIELGEIEAVLRQHPDVAEGVVLVRPRHSADSAGHGADLSLVAYVVPQPGRAPAPAALGAFLKTKLPDYMLPSAFALLEALPLTPHGKVDRQALPALELVRPDLPTAFVEPRSPVEALLAGLWSEVLNVQRIGVHDNFFELGGHSLLATQVIARLREAFQVELPLRALFEAPTVAGLAGAIAARRDTGGLLPPIRPAARDGSSSPLPLSFAQERLWFLNQLEPHNPFYNIPAAVRLMGPLDVAALESSLDRIVGRHEILRTMFQAVDGRPTQVTAPALTLGMPLIDLQALPSPEQERLLQKLARDDARRTFDLARGPLARVTLLRLAPDEHVLLLNLHHIIADGWSMGVLIREVAALYRALVHGEPSPLPGLPVQYADFAVWQKQWLTQAEALGPLLDYWRAQLAGAPPALALPADRPRPAVQTFHGATHPFTLSSTLTGGLNALSRKLGSTLFMVLLAGFKALLCRIADQEDILVGAPIANRQRVEVEGLIGFFANTLVLRTDLSGNPSFRELVQRVREVALQAYTYQDLPFEKLVEELQPRRDLSHTPLFQVMFALQSVQNTPAPALDAADLTLRRLDLDSGTSKFDLTLSFVETEQALLGRVEYNTDLFEPETIARWVGHLETLLAACVAAPDARLWDLPLLTDLEQRRALAGWSAADAETLPAADVSIVEQVEAQAAQTPDAAAVVFGGQVLTYQALNRRANRLAHHLRGLGLGPEKLAGICLERSLDMVVGVLAVLKAGGAYLPLDPAYPPERLAYMLEVAGADTPVVLTRVDEMPGLAGCGARLVDPGLVEAFSGQDPANLAAEVMPDTLAYVLFTSGSTGRPKGAAMTHRALANLLSWQRQHWTPPQAARTLQFASLSFDVAFQEIFSTWISGGTLVLISEEDRRDPALLLGCLEASAVERLFLPFVALQALAEIAGRSSPLPWLREIITAGEQLLIVPPIARWLKQLDGCVLHNQYGPSESHVVTAFTLGRPVDDWPRVPPIGKPIPRTQIYLLDRQMRSVPLGVAGEIYIGGVSLARGYHNRPDLTAERFVPNPFTPPLDLPHSYGMGGAPGGGRLYKTGDLARRLPDGQIEFLGRRDGQVKLRGFRIELGEIETTLSEHADVARAVVLVRDADQAPGHRRLVAYVVPQAQVVTGGDLRRFLQARLPDYMVPSAFVMLEALPMTPSGKVDRRRLPEPDRLRPELDEAYTPPRTSTEALIAGLWADVLGLERAGGSPVGIHDNFFELGGHSLLATQLVARLWAATGVQLPLRTLFQAPTVAGLAEAVAQLKAASAGEGQAGALPVIVPAPDEQHEPFPLTDVQQAYWVGRSGAFELGNVATHGYLEIDTVGLDLDRLAVSLRRLIDRHPMLRALVLPDGQQQVLREVPEYQIQCLDLSQHDAQSAAARLLAVRERMSHQVMPSDRWPLFEIAATRLDDRRVRLHVSYDVLMSDARSLQILRHELVRLYQQPDISLPPLTLSFRDYVLSEKAFQGSAAYRHSLAYWQDRLPALPPAPELPLAQSPEALQQPRFVRRTARLDREVWARLKRRAARAGLTPSGVLLAAYAEILNAWSKSSRFTINLTLFNRLPVHPHVNDIAGDFTSLTLLAVDPTAPEPFEARARRIQARLWEDLDHRSVSGVRVLRELAQTQAGGSRTVGMPVVFTSILGLTDSSAPGAEDSSLMGEVVFAISQTPQVWLDHQVLESDGQLILNWDAVDALFPPGMLDDMFGAYQAWLGRLADDEACWHETRRLLLPPDQLEQRAVMNATEAPVTAELLQAGFIRQVQCRPQAPAVITSARTLTYQALFHRSNQVARWLLQSGAQPNRLVAVVMDKGWEQVVAVLGILQAGAAYLPIDSTLPRERVWYLLQNGEADLVLTQSWVDSGMAWPDGVRRLCVDSADLSAFEESALEPRQRPEDLAYVIFTSGSTGQPKGVMIDHRGAVNTVDDVNQRFGVGPQDRVFALSALSFDLSVYDIFGPLRVGGAIVIPDAAHRLEPAAWAALSVRAGVTVWNSVPALMELLVDYLAGRGERLPPSLRLVLLSGDWIPVALPERVNALTGAVQLVSLGGATEASIWSILFSIETVDPAWKSIPYGRPMLNQRFYVLDAACEPCPTWVPGQLYIGGVGLAQGYWRDEDKTRSKFIIQPHTGERLYGTGDLGRYLPDGTIEFLGREDFQVKVQGYRIELAEVEAALLQHPGVRAAVVEVRGEPRGVRRLIGYCVSNHDPAPSASELRAFLKTKLPDYMVPSAFVTLDALPLSANGKVDRRSLPEPALSPGSGTQALAAVPAEIVTRMRSAIASVLQLDPHTIEMDANLLQLGATSVDLIRIANALEREIGFRPRLDAFYLNPTVSGLAAAYHEHRAAFPTPARKDAAMPSLLTLIASTDLLRDPDEREAFKQSQPGLRRGLEADASVELPAASDADPQRFRERRSHRHFSPGRVPLQRLGELLGCLRQWTQAGGPRYLYPSAGGLYPVQVYVHVKDGRVAGLDGGGYYYHPVDHRLVALSPGAALDRGIHEALTNRPIFDEAALSIFCVAQLDAVTPMYGENSLLFVTLETGYMSQLLMMTAAGCGIGLCPIGVLDFQPVRPLFRLEESQVLIHSFLGGLAPDDVPEPWSPVQEPYVQPGTSAPAREEGEV